MPPEIPEAKFGLWSFWRASANGDAERRFIGADTMAILGRVSLLTLNRPDTYETVMEDSVRELRRHAPIFRHGAGRVLVSGLGLGCVVRGLLAKPDVDHIDVVEIDREILAHFGEQFTDNPRVALHHGDALTFEWPPGTQWDYGWHDIHCVKTDSVAFLHARLFARFYDRCGRQGWWGRGARIARRFAKERVIAT